MIFSKKNRRAEIFWTHADDCHAEWRESANQKYPTADPKSRLPSRGVKMERISSGCGRVTMEGILEQRFNFGF
jgi:hypothetical protein